jgi:hypothetical protein
MSRTLLLFALARNTLVGSRAGKSDEVNIVGANDHPRRSANIACRAVARKPQELKSLLPEAARELTAQQ